MKRPSVWVLPMIDLVGMLAVLAAIVAFALAGCGGVTVAASVDGGAPDSRGDVVAVEGPSLDSPVTDAGTETTSPRDLPDARDAATCAPWTTPPYCSSCRDSRGVCMCGALACCDQHCQS